MIPFAPLQLLSPDAVLLALLLAGHVFADFLVQTSRVAAAKGSSGLKLVQHAGWSTLTHALVLFPFWSVSLLGGVLLLGALHLAIDACKSPLERRFGKRLLIFFVDQAVHIAAILITWRTLVWQGAHVGGWLSVPGAWYAPLGRAALVAAGLVFNGRGGTVIVRLVLERYPQVIPKPADGESEESGEYAMGRTIGCLERFLLFILVLLEQWGALGFVIAAKSIARFRELENQQFADYYLIGTLTSTLIAIGSGILVRVLVLP
jgi:hypothetical protein